MKFNRNQNFREAVALNTYTGGPDTPETTFWENLKAAGTVTINEDLSISDSLNQKLYQEREATLRNAIADGTIPEWLAETYRKDTEYDFGYMAQYAKDYLNMDVMTDDEIKNNIEQSLGEQRAYQQEVYSRAGFGGKVGAFMGMVGPQIVDPIYVPLYFTGVGGAARGTAFLARLGKLAALEAGVEGMKQSIVMNHKHRINSEYSAKDAIYAIAGAGIGMVGFEVTGRVLGKGLRKLAQTDHGVFGADVSAADIAFARQEVNSFADLMERASDPDMPAEQILEEFNKSATAFNKASSEDKPDIALLEELPTETKAMQSELETELTRDPELLFPKKQTGTDGVEIDTLVPMKEEYIKTKEFQSQVDEAIKCFTAAA